jgi:hypothetical protein
MTTKLAETNFGGITKSDFSFDFYIIFFIRLNLFGYQLPLMYEQALRSGLGFRGRNID